MFWLIKLIQYLINNFNTKKSASLCFKHANQIENQGENFSSKNLD
jgi:hypothetical protein